jgi:hypothetical protein
MAEFDSRKTDKEMTSNEEREPALKIVVPKELVEVIRVGVRANREVSGSVALGGAICALYCQHRTSIDIDFVLTDLRDRFQEIREHLFEVPDWKEAQAKRPVLILGSLSGVEVGYRQLRRATPLETQDIELLEGTLKIPTLEELLRVKAFLLYDRNNTRDFVDFAELTCLLDTEKVVEALSSLDEKFSWEKQPSIVLGVIKTLLNPEPHDTATHGFETLKLLNPKLTTWVGVSQKCQEVGKALSLKILGGKE